MADRWIVIPGWDTFQHPDVGRSNRNPIWVRNYTELLHKDEYLRLSAHQRGVLHGLWMLYASSGCQLRASTASLTRQLAVRVSSRQLQALETAGFIEVSACRPQAQNRKEKKRTKGLTYPEYVANSKGPGFQIPEDLLKELP